MAVPAAVGLVVDRVHHGPCVVTPAPLHHAHGQMAGAAVGRRPARLLQARPFGQSTSLAAAYQGPCATRARTSRHRQVQRLIHLVLVRNGAVPRVVDGSVAVVVKVHAWLGLWR